MNIMICFVFCILLLERCTSLTGRVCKVEGLEYCCSESQNVTGVCVDCGLGFTSLIAQRCLPCKYPFFGSKCSFKCKCRNNQRCDNVVGCVDIPTMEDTTEATYSDSTASEHTIKTSSVILTESTKIDRGNDGEKETKSLTDFSERALIAYTAAAACLLLVMGMCFLVKKYRIMSHSRQLKISQPAFDGIPLDKNDDPAVKQDDEYLYEEIDESELTDSVFKVSAENAYLEVIDEPGDSDLINEYNGYLTPLPSLFKDESKVVQNFNYPSLKMPILHRPQINRLDSDSRSSSESVMRNEGYLNPYQPLREIYTSISHRYEIPRLYSSMKNLLELRVKYQNLSHHEDVYNDEQIGSTRNNKHFDNIDLSNKTSRNKQEIEISDDTCYTDCLSKLVKKGRIHSIKSGSI